MSDMGEGYFSIEFDTYYEEYDIIHECSASRTRQQNNIAKIIKND